MTDEQLKLLQEIKRGQDAGFERVGGAIAEQSKAIGKLNGRVAAIEARLPSLEAEQERHREQIESMRAVQDGCKPRINWDEETTEIREMRIKLEKAAAGKDAKVTVSLNSTSKTVATAIAGVLIAIVSVLGTYFSTAEEGQKDSVTESAPAPETGGTDSGL